VRGPAAGRLPPHTPRAGLALAGGGLYGASQEGHRAADAAALAGAAALPTVNVGTGPTPIGVPGPSQLDTPLGTVDTAGELPTLGQDFVLGACRIAALQFQPTRSPVTATSSGTTSCTASVGLGDQWLQRLADCLAGWSASAGCAQQLESSLESRLPAPAPTDPVTAALRDAATRAGQTGQVV